MALPDDQGIALVRRAYAALGNSDLMAFASTLHPAAVWHHPVGYGLPRGAHHQGALAIMRHVLAPPTGGSALISYDPEAYFSGNDHVLALGRAGYPTATADVSGEFAHLWRHDGTAIHEVHAFEDTAMLLNHRSGPSEP